MDIIIEVVKIGASVTASGLVGFFAAKRMADKKYNRDLIVQERDKVLTEKWIALAMLYDKSIEVKARLMFLVAQTSEQLEAGLAPLQDALFEEVRGKLLYLPLAIETKFIAVDNAVRGLRDAYKKFDRGNDSFRDFGHENARIQTELDNLCRMCSEEAERLSLR